MIEKLPNYFFSDFPSLRHLDLRQNRLLEIPVSIAGHNCLEVLLLQDNQLMCLPYEIGTVREPNSGQINPNSGHPFFISGIMFHLSGIRVFDCKVKSV